MIESLSAPAKFAMSSSHPIAGISRLKIGKVRGTPATRHSRESGNPFRSKGSNPNSSARSRHLGFPASINSIFHARRHFLICFSRRIARSIVECCSNQTSLRTPYLLEKPSNVPFRCWAMRRSKGGVTPW